MFLCERSQKIEVEDRIQKTNVEDEERVFGLPGAVRSLRMFKEVVVDLAEEFPRLGKALKWKIYYFIGFSAQALTLVVFFNYRGCHITSPSRGLTCPTKIFVKDNFHTLGDVSNKPP